MMITSAIPSNTSIAELINQISMDLNATEREKYLMRHIEEIISNREDFDDERDEYESQISTLEDELGIAEEEIKRLNEEIADLKKNKEGAASE
jgi:chromosome segregation ATPase